MTIALAAGILIAIFMGEASITWKARRVWMVVMAALLVTWVVVQTIQGNGVYALGSLIIATIISGLYILATYIRLKREKRHND